MSKIIEDAFKDIDPERSNILNWLLDVIEKLNNENENLKKQLANTLPIQNVSSPYICDCKIDPCYTYDWEQCEDCKKKYES